MLNYLLIYCDHYPATDVKDGNDDDDDDDDDDDEEEDDEDEEANNFKKPS